MRRFRLSKKAASDLDSIWYYIACDDPDAADRFIDRLRTTFPSLAEFPNMGSRREYLSNDIRILPVGNYVVVYRLEKSRIVIVRIIHAAQDIRHLKD